VQKLLQGIHQFQNNVFGSRRELFQRLAEGQQPEALFITCSDSRINPNLLTQTEPGELFILRNAGNIVPSHGAANGGEGATVEFAVAALGVRDVIVCGHSHCGAMKGLLHPEHLDDLPAVAAWLAHAEATRRILRAKYAGRPADDLLAAAVEENVLVQLENLRTHPAIAAGLARRTLRLHGWVYRIETGEVLAHDPGRGQFVPLMDRLAALSPTGLEVPVTAG
jgi:carbonic anhydrase